MYKLVWYDGINKLKWTGSLTTMLKLIAKYDMQYFDLVEIDSNGIENIHTAMCVRDGKDISLYV